MAREMKDSGVAWIGEIPAKWEVKRMRHILCSNDGGIWGDDPLNDGTDKIVLRSTEQTVDGQWSIINPATRSLTAVDYSKYRISPGDLLITKSSGSGSHIGKTTIADSTFSVGEYYYSNFIQRIRISGSNPTFVWYLLNSPITREQFVYLQNSTSGIGNINADMIQNIYVPIPPIIEQEKIVTFLNRKCAEIDSVLDKTRTSIEKYKKLKQTIITQAVTKGVRGDRPMKGSGIIWLDAVPEDWKISKIKYTISPHEKPVLPSDDVITCFRDGTVTLRKNRREEGFTVSFTENGYQGVDVGDLVIHGMDTFAGAIGCSDSRGKTSPVVHVCSTVGNNRYFMYFLRYMAYSNVLMDFSNGVRIRSSDFRNFKKLAVFEMLVPPLEEQNEIVNYLDGSLAKIEQVIKQKDSLISEIESYKKTVIYEYVTGKKEVDQYD